MVTPKDTPKRDFATLPSAILYRDELEEIIEHLEEVSEHSVEIETDDFIFENLEALVDHAGKSIDEVRFRVRDDETYRTTLIDLTLRHKPEVLKRSNIAIHDTRDAYQTRAKSHIEDVVAGCVPKTLPLYVTFKASMFSLTVGLIFRPGHISLFRPRLCCGHYFRTSTPCILHLFLYCLLPP